MLGGLAPNHGSVEPMRVLLGLAVLATAPAAWAQTHAFNFDFDTDAEGWTRGSIASTRGLFNITNTPVNYNASLGLIEGSDWDNYAYYFSPDFGGVDFGDLYGEVLSYDYRSNGSGGNNPQVVIASTNDFLIFSQPINASPVLETYAMSLNDTQGWTFNGSPYFGNGSAATEMQIRSVLADLRYIGVSTDIVNGGDFTQLDNVKATPEPGLLAALGIGAAAAAWRRKRKA